VTEQAPQVAFVRGCPRSGTTLLADIMNESPDIGLLIEMPFGDLVRRMLPILWYEDNVNRERAAIADAGKRVAESAAPPETGASFIPLDNRHQVTYARRYPTRERLAAIVTAVVEASMEKPNLKIVGSKTPGRWDEFELDVVKSVFPRVKYVFVVRHPLETINSIVNRRNAGRAGLDFWPYQHVSEAIDAYFESTAALLSCVAAYGDDCYVVGYEDLIANPEPTLAALGAFLGVELRDRTALIEKAGPSTRILTPDEDESVHAAFGQAIATWRDKRLTGPGTSIGRQLDDCVRVLEIGREYRFDAPATDRSLLGAGWSALEPQGVWTEALTAEAYFAVPEEGQYIVTLEFGGYVPSAQESLSFGLALGERQAFTATLSDTRIVRVKCGPAAFSPSRAQRLRFSFSALRSPADRGLGADYRRLGVCLRGLLLEKAATS
jgi:hypothetical protein